VKQPTADMLSRHPLEFWEAVDYFNQNRLKIRKRYKRNFVAILDDSVVDSDPDYGDLADRCRAQMPGRDPYLAYAAAMSRDEMREKFFIENVDDALDRGASVEHAAEEFIKRFATE
jgi:hypothetical protein